MQVVKHLGPAHLSTQYTSALIILIMNKLNILSLDADISC